MHETLPIPELVGGIVGLLLVAALTLAMAKRFNIPFTVALVVVGMALSWLAGRFPEWLGIVDGFRISPGIILYVFLPTLIFESAYNLDARLLRGNLSIVLLLAIPGLLISTAIIGGIVSAATGIALTAAFLLGAILSATDPVAVIALFKSLGAPKRLTVLVEGESLFNDATAIVLANILAAVLLQGAVSMGVVGDGILEFLQVFVGGLAVGWFLGVLTGWALGKVESDPFIEITLTTIVAYFSFLLAEELLHLSGVMATVGAGLVLGGWGRVKVSLPVRTYLEHFWEYMAFVATALIFLMLGLRMEFGSLWEARDVLFWVILAMLVSRAVVVYGLMPLVGRLPGEGAVDLKYRTVIYWGGLRGAIALAIVLSLEANPATDSFVVLVTGAVLFTLLVQGLSIKPLVVKLGLDTPPVTDQFARVESELAAKERARERIPELMAGGRFSGAISKRLQREYEESVHRIKEAIDELRDTRLDKAEEEKLSFLLAFAEEKAVYVEMFNHGHLSEGAFRELITVLSLQIDRVRMGASFHVVRSQRMWRRDFEHAILRSLDRFPLLSPIVERLRIARLATNYEISWGHLQSSARVINSINEMDEFQSLDAEVLEEMRGRYGRWRRHAREQLDRMWEHFPEFVASMQEQLGRRLVMLAESEAIEEHSERGTLPKSIAEEMQHEISHELRSLRGQLSAKLRVDPAELMRKVPFFACIPHDHFDDLARHLHALTVSEGEAIIRQGALGDTLYFIARGVVRVTRESNGATQELASLMAGDFFGEMGSLHGGPRSATASAATPCSLYELRRAQFDNLLDKYPGVREALERADVERRAKLDQG